MVTEPGAQTLQGTAFTYQGELRQNSAAVSGNVDLIFQLYDAPIGGNQVGATLNFTAGNGNPVTVSNGLFTVALDFGALAFNTLATSERYLKVTVNGNPLAPRTKIESAPYALQSRTAELAYTVSNASVGAAQIVPAQVQQRVTGTCTVGSSIQSIAQDGTVTCQTAGTVTSVGSGSGLTGGPITSSGTLAVDTGAIQARITGTCGASQKVLAVNSNGSVVCADDATGSSGTVTSITAGTGLEGGTITTSGTVGIANGGVGAAQLASGAVGLAQINTAQVQARVVGTCSFGEYVRGINADGSVVCASVQWSTTIDVEANVSGTSIAIGSDGLPVVSYYVSGAYGNLKVAHCANLTCLSGATVVTPDSFDNVGLFSSIAIGNDGVPVVSYYDITNGDLKVAYCTNAMCNNNPTRTAVDTTGDVGVTTSIAIGSDGLPVVSYHDNTNGDLKIAHCANEACTGAATITAVDTTGDVGLYSSIAIGADNWPVVGYYDETNGDLKVAHCSNATCTGAVTVATVDSVGDVGHELSVAIGNDGLPVMSYYDATNLDLKVAHCANVSCTGTATVTTVDSVGSVGRFSSIAIGSDGLPVVSYGDYTNFDLKVAHCSNQACTGTATITTVDAAGQVGSYTSIAVGGDGMPVVSYEGNGNLKMVKCNNRFCQ